MVTLPVSGAAVAFRDPDGVDDMLLHEATGGAVEVAAALLDRLCEPSLDAADLTVTDFEYLLLQLRARRLGENMTLAFACPHCRALSEVDFRIADFVAVATPRRAPGVAPDPSRASWFVLEGASFRLPTAADQIEVAGYAVPTARLAELCLDETARRRPHRARVERAMEIMAPMLSRDIAGHCAACGLGVRAEVVVTPLVIGELKRAAGAVHDEVDLIARAYHWPEAQILALPQPRRRAYAERIRRVRSQAA
jgi:hypothetical protein